MLKTWWLFKVERVNKSPLVIHRYFEVEVMRDACITPQYTNVTRLFYTVRCKVNNSTLYILESLLNFTVDAKKANQVEFIEMYPEMYSGSPQQRRSKMPVPSQNTQNIKSYAHHN